MGRFLFLIVLTPCLLPVVGVTLLALASLWRTLAEDRQRRDRER